MPLPSVSLAALSAACTLHAHWLARASSLRLKPADARCRCARREKSCSECKKFNRVLKQAAAQGLLERLQGQSLKVGKVRCATSSVAELASYQCCGG